MNKFKVGDIVQLVNFEFMSDKKITLTKNRSFYVKRIDNVHSDSEMLEIEDIKTKTHMGYYFSYRFKFAVMETIKYLKNNL